MSSPSDASACHAPVTPRCAASADSNYGAIAQLPDHDCHHDCRPNCDPNCDPNCGFSLQALWNKGFKTQTDISSIKNSQLRSFYESQNNLLQRMATASKYHETLLPPHKIHHACIPHPSPTTPPPLTILPTIHHQEAAPQLGRRNTQRTTRTAILASNICNAFLLCAQIYAFLSTTSLSLLAVFIDALLDMVSGLVVAFTWSLKHRKDKIRYPVGRRRLEPLGVIAMACLMTAATLVTLEQSIGALLEAKPRVLTFTISTALVLLTALATKASLFAYCHTIDDDAVQALAEDHFNDCLSNSLGLLTIILANHLVWWVDPVGAIIISLWIIRNWSLLTLRHCDQLLGKVASPDILNLITFVACNHSAHILLVDTVRAYHVGSGIYTEVHVVLDATMPLSVAHDVGESLQNRIETLDHVERCFVHLDVEALHSPDVEHKDI